MQTKDILSATVQWVESKMSGETTGHDWWHTYRVWKNATHISSVHGGNLFIIEMAALLHDMGDHKFHNGIDKTKETAMFWLDQFVSISSDDKEHIASICCQLSFKGANVDTDMPTTEGKIVQDADRLDALGAIGIARAFAYGGKKNRMIHDPLIKPSQHNSFEQYITSGSTTINHFYEKLLLLENRMQTEEGKKMAQERTQFLHLFLNHFFEEWDVR
jgi:uncharacterized protein